MEKRKRKYFYGLEIGKIFLSLKKETLKEKTDRFYYIKIFNFCTTKHIMNNIK